MKNGCLDWLSCMNGLQLSKENKKDDPTQIGTSGSGKKSNFSASSNVKETKQKQGNHCPLD